MTNIKITFIKENTHKNMKKIIADILAKVLKNLYNLESQDIDLETPPKPEF